jgi:hypothetical protein
LGVGGILGLVVYFYLLSAQVAKAYNFGAGTGCLAIVLGSAVLFAVFFCGGCFLSSALGNALGGV